MIVTLDTLLGIHRKNLLHYCSYVDANKQAYKHTHIQTYKQTYKHTYIQTYKQTNIKNNNNLKPHQLVYIMLFVSRCKNFREARHIR